MVRGAEGVGGGSSSWGSTLRFCALPVVVVVYIVTVVADVDVDIVVVIDVGIVVCIVVPIRWGVHPVGCYPIPLLGWYRLAGVRSWRSKPLRWEVWCWVLILRWFARLGLLMSSFPAPALSAPRPDMVWVSLLACGLRAPGGFMLRCLTLCRVMSWNPYRCRGTVWLSSNASSNASGSVA
jgi:hypothetical protein